MGNENRIKSRYTLHYNKSNKSFSIYHYEDIQKEVTANEHVLIKLKEIDMNV